MRKRVFILIYFLAINVLLLSEASFFVPNINRSEASDYVGSSVKSMDSSIIGIYRNNAKIYALECIPFIGLFFFGQTIKQTSYALASIAIYGNKTVDEIIGFLLGFPHTYFEFMGYAIGLFMNHQVILTLYNEHKKVGWMKALKKAILFPLTDEYELLLWGLGFLFLGAAFEGFTIILSA